MRGAAACLDDSLEDREEILDSADLLVGDEDVRIVEHGLHALGVGDHVGRQVALVELHALGELGAEVEGLALLDVHDAVLADLLDRVGDHVADLARANRWMLATWAMSLARDLLGLRLEALDDGLDRGLDAALETHRVRARGDVLQALADDGLGEHGRGCRAVAGNAVRRRGDSRGTSCAPWFSSKTSSTSISRAMVTPSFVMVGRRTSCRGRHSVPSGQG